MKRLITSSALTLVFALALHGTHAGDPKSLVEPGAKVKKLADGMKFTEGPVWLPAQKMLVVGPDGKTYEALYSMEKQPDGTWRISGCTLLEIPGLDA